MQTYQLSIQLAEDVEITIGRLGRFLFPAGSYVYTGSAKRNIIDRVKRHLSHEKKLKWHIDYLLANQFSGITDVRFFRKSECMLNQDTRGDIVVPGFGSSDCCQACDSHLKHQ